MSVNYSTPAREMLFPVSGVRLGTAAAAIRKRDRRDLTLIELAADSRVAGVFTQNRFCAAPVQLCRQHLADGNIRALIINTGVANAGTGESGFQAAKQSCAAVAEMLGCAATQVLPFSTGVILEPLPVERLVAGLPDCLADLSDDHWHAAAHAIMTTDTVAKAASRRLTIGGKTVAISGMAKGAGMIRPNMATMLGFVATDAAVSQAVLETLVKEIAAVSFNCITVDGDTSTNDSFVIVATGRAGHAEIVDVDCAEAKLLRQALQEVAIELAQAIIRDGEGATKFITVAVAGGRDVAECKAVGYAIGHSPLVKTAFFASDPNLGRILAAIGYAGVADLDVHGIRVWLASGNDVVLVAEDGGRASSYREEDGARVMKQAEIDIRIDLARGKSQATIWSCDFSYEYVKINADYRS